VSSPEAAKRPCWGLAAPTAGYRRCVVARVRAPTNRFPHRSWRASGTLDFDGPSAFFKSRQNQKAVSPERRLEVPHFCGAKRIPLRASLCFWLTTAARACRKWPIHAGKRLSPTGEQAGLTGRTGAPTPFPGETLTFSVRGRPLVDGALERMLAHTWRISAGDQARETGVPALLDIDRGAAGGPHRRKRISDAVVINTVVAKYCDHCVPRTCRRQRRCGAMEEMRVGPSKPEIRIRLQTTASCCR
jgi:hypothetical protein